MPNYVNVCTFKSYSEATIKSASPTGSFLTSKTGCAKGYGFINFVFNKNQLYLIWLFVENHLAHISFHTAIKTALEKLKKLKKLKKILKF